MRLISALDYPFLINSDGKLITSLGLRTNTVNTSYIRDKDKDGNETWRPGALLAYTVRVDKPLHAGEKVVFDWTFLTFRTLNWNDFAFFYTYEANASLKDAIEEGGIFSGECLLDALALEDHGIFLEV